MIDLEGDAGTSGGGAENDEIDEVLKRKRVDLEHLVLWFSGIDATDKPLDDPVELCSGRAFAEILNRIDEAHFDSTWLESMPESTTRRNTVVKQSNLRKLWRKVLAYIQEVLGRKLETQRYHEIDSKVCGTWETDLPVALEFAMIICTLAHVGRNKEDFVLYSKDLSSKNAEEMSNVVRMITEIMREIPETNEQRVFSDEELTSDGELNSSAMMDRNLAGRDGSKRMSIGSYHYQHEIEHMTKIIEELQNEKKKLESDVEMLTNRIENDAQIQSILSPTTGQTSTSAEESTVIEATVSRDTVELLEKANEELLKKRRDADDKVHELEGHVEQIKGALEEVSMQNEELKRQEKQWRTWKIELQTARDSMEIWREKAEKLEIDGEMLKKREKENRELQTQIKLLNNRLEHHVKVSTQDEGNKTEMANLRQHIGSLKANIVAKDVELVAKLSTLTKLEEDVIGLKERVRELEDRKEELTEERNRLQEKLIKMSDAGTTMRSLHDSMMDGEGSGFENGNKLSLEIENQRLLERIQELESLEPLKGEIMSLKSRNSVLEQETQVAQRRCDEKQAEIDELAAKLDARQQTVSHEVVELKMHIEQLTLTGENARAQAEKAELRHAEMLGELAARQAECERYEQSLQKSKCIIDLLEEQCRGADDAETQAATQGGSVQQFKQLQYEKEVLEKKVLDLETQLHTTTTSYEQENRLLTSAAHRMVSNRCAEEVLYQQQQQTPPKVSVVSNQKQSSAISWRVLLKEWMDNTREYRLVYLFTALVPIVIIFMLNGLSTFLAPPNA